MHGNSEVLVIDDHLKRRQQLELLLEFVGEPCKLVDSANVGEVLTSQVAWRSVLVGQVDAGGQASLVKQLASEYKAQPFLLIGENDESLSALPNVIGSVLEPFSHGQMTQMLHQCQDYHLKAPTATKPTNQHQEILFRSLIGRSSSIQQVRQLIQQVAGTDANVLVLGDSGTGKEVVARNIHYLSARRKGPFVPVNCGAIPAELLESELFGHEKGAFTGAISARKGRFEMAQGGTLFLDEIGDMPLNMQVKLLRVLQERCFERVGGTTSITADVRVVAATHRNLEGMIEKGDFREDLFYRLNVFPIEMPSLSERSEDVPLLMQELVERLGADHKAGIRLTELALESLMKHDWPGNVRELANLVERLVILFPNGMVDVNDLPSKYRHLEAPAYEHEYDESLLEQEMLNEVFQTEVYVPPENTVSTQLPPEGVNLKEMMTELEIDMIRQALDTTDWVVSRAADLLGMRRTTLVEKMRKYSLSKDTA
ncbi:sigma-54-dependent Fis family transcriptional regulator [Neiella sp. HB171785]|uniref:Sigma-54-dependent Fis family transcriptional regulator n=1 Tax=Neiella litorisoli TaxID=2771431 RepID=A0A8J6UQC2_9GAMM|nr:sigma-54 dependent transcriptional regulator [Neiella litorisoli]MBD1390857.1 sigma-54-dependent Fis family transcriptional regulator [Neiella litorisoli]